MYICYDILVTFPLLRLFMQILLGMLLDPSCLSTSFPLGHSNRHNSSERCREALRNPRDNSFAWSCLLFAFWAVVPVVLVFLL